MRSLTHDTMSLTILALTLVAALSAPSPSRAQGVLNRDPMDTLQDAEASFSRVQEEWREREVEGRLAGKAYIPESYPVDASEFTAAALDDFDTASKSKRAERCYCDLDLFCKRFGCRRRKRVVSAKRIRPNQHVVYQTPDMIVRLIQRLWKQKNRSIRSHLE